MVKLTYLIVDFESRSKNLIKQETNVSGITFDSVKLKSTRCDFPTFAAFPFFSMSYDLAFLML